MAAEGTDQATVGYFASRWKKRAYGIVGLENYNVNHDIICKP